jgi:lantibiotic biosynthesis protein
MNWSRVAIVKTARHLALQLCKEALWLGDECTWLGLDLRGTPGASEIIANTLKGEVYGGTAGIAYFLLDMAAVTGESIFRDTGLGALNFSCRLSDIESEAIGFFDGFGGVAIVSCLAAELVDDASMRSVASKMIGKLSSRIHSMPRMGSDVISGAAGLLNGLACLNERYTPNISGQMSCLSEHILATAVSDVRGRYWRQGEGQSGLTGYSHGASGIALALLEASQKLPDLKVDDAVLAAFDFEDSYFSKSQGNWADLRAYGGRSQERPSFGLAWCHGAPGILLSRARATELGLVCNRELALAAYKTSAEALRWIYTTATFDTGLCHGASGIVSILEYASAILGINDSDLIDQGSQAIRSAAEEGCLPNSLSNFEATPQLMVGSAGVGHFLLQLAKVSHLPWILHPPRGRPSSSASWQPSR